jgi:hypothetical protein
MSPDRDQGARRADHQRAVRRPDRDEQSVPAKLRLPERTLGRTAAVVLRADAGDRRLPGGGTQPLLPNVALSKA